jgi:hypothetical protein
MYSLTAFFAAHFVLPSFTALDVLFHSSTPWRIRHIEVVPTSSFPSVLDLVTKVHVMLIVLCCSVATFSCSQADQKFACHQQSNGLNSPTAVAAATTIMEPVVHSIALAMLDCWPLSSTSALPVIVRIFTWIRFMLIAMGRRAINHELMGNRDSEGRTMSAARVSRNWMMPG